MRRNLKISLVILVLFVSSAFNLPKNIEKKVSKEINTFFEISQFSKESVIIPSALKNKLPLQFDTTSLFKIKTNNNLIAYLYVGKAPSKTDEFDYMVLLDKELRVLKSKVLVYRENYGSEIGSKRWLKQFVGQAGEEELRYEVNIDAISGATISAKSMTIAMNSLLKSITILHENRVF